MTYRVAQGPASLRLEIPAFADHLARLFGIDAVRMAEWCSSTVPDFPSRTAEAIRRAPVPFDVPRQKSLLRSDQFPLCRSILGWNSFTTQVRSKSSRRMSSAS